MTMAGGTQATVEHGKRVKRDWVRDGQLVPLAHLAQT
jgi:hypothetical protein